MRPHPNVVWLIDPLQGAVFRLAVLGIVNFDATPLTDGFMVSVAPDSERGFEVLEVVDSSVRRMNDRV